MQFKYPKTPRFKNLDEKDILSWKNLTAVISEKLDGANSGIYFDDENNLVLQSRGHILVGGAREAQFNLFKAWCHNKSNELYDILGNKYVMFGEWCYAKHRLFYDSLPSYFLEFDIFDKENNKFISTQKRKALINNKINSVQIIHQDKFNKINNFEQYIGKSNYKSYNSLTLFEEIMESGMKGYYSYDETDNTNLMEGICVKIENDEEIIGRFKLLRDGLSKVRMNDEKWQRRPIFQNKTVNSA